MMVASEVFKKLDGFDERFAVAFNDIDLCMKARQHGYNNVFSPFAELYHYESKSRGAENKLSSKVKFIL